MTEQTPQKPILILGGTGKTGGRLAARLTERGVAVRIGSRFAEPPFNWHDQATWEPALRDVAAVYIAYWPDVGAPGAAAVVQSFAELAVRSGVRRLVLLSGRGEEEAERSEEALKSSGADWTILRSSWFSQNFSEGFFVDEVRRGEVALPASDVGEPFTDVEDIADVAAAVLTEDGHVGQLYELTGPRLLTFAEAVAEISAASGRDMRFTSVSIEDFAAGLAKAAVPAEFVDFLTYLFAEVLDGRNAHVTDGVQRVLKRPARDFREYARQTAAAGVWEVS